MTSSGNFQVYKQGGTVIRGRSRLLGVIAIVALLLAVVGASVRTIQAGTVGVVKRLGRVSGEVLDPGLHFIVPFTDSVIVYNTKDIVYEVAPADKHAGSHADYVDFPVDSTTQDGQQVIMSYSIRFRIIREQTVRIANELGDEAAVVEKVIKFHSRVVARQVPRNFKASELYTGDVAKAQLAIEEELRPLFQEKGLSLEAFGIREITFSPDYIQAVEQKQIEREKVMTEQHRAEQAEYRKQAVITEAQGAAEAIRLKGEALKDNPNIVQLEFVNAIRDPNSAVKLMVIPSGSVLPILDLGSQAAALTGSLIDPNATSVASVTASATQAVPSPTPGSGN
jgi:regulator of protease activity HflC (stomatin/prohibitin superfamily)